MLKEFKLPDLGEGIHEGEIVDVLVKPGDRVEDGQPVLVVETDKATTEIPAPVTGVVKDIRVKPGDVVKVGQVLIVFSDEAEEPAEPARVIRDAAKEGETEEKPAPREEGPKEERKAPPSPKERGEGKPEPTGVSPERGEVPVPAAPSTRRLARELGVDLRQVASSGPAGLVTAEDVRAHAEGRGKAEAPPRPAEEEEAPPMAAGMAAGKAPPLPDFARWGTVERVPLKSVRRATARHMALSWSQIPHVTHSDVADITELEAFRRRHKAEIEARGGALSMTVFALKAALVALRAFPYFNSSIDSSTEEIILKRYYHIGVAVDSHRGLIVPTIRDVDRKSMVELSQELLEMANRARNGKTASDELSGGTFTITNIGILGGTGFTPIINYPQVAILGLAQARMQPVVTGDMEDLEVTPRLMLPLIIGFDHRVVDGADAARFLKVVIDVLESPEKLMMMI